MDSDLQTSHSALFPISMSSGYKLNGKKRLYKEITNFQIWKVKITDVNYQSRLHFIFIFLS